MWALVGGALSAASGIIGGFGKKKQLQAQANEARKRAGVLRENANVVRNEGSHAEDVTRKGGREAISGQSSLFAQVGNAGVTGDLAKEESVNNLESDVSALRYNYEASAQQYLNQAAMEEYRASMLEDGADGAVLGGFLDGALSLAGGGLSMAQGLAAKKETPQAEAPSAAVQALTQTVPQENPNVTLYGSNSFYSLMRYGAGTRGLPNNKLALGW